MKICEICGDEFDESRKTQRYCRVCGKNPDQARSHYARAEIINRIHAGDLHKVKETTCPVCGNEFVWQKEKATQIYCSPECGKIAAGNRKAKSKEDAKKKLKIGEELNICTICKTPQMDCERFTSNFIYKPKGAVTKKINDKYIIVSCPKYKGGASWLI